MVAASCKLDTDGFEWWPIEDFPTLNTHPLGLIPAADKTVSSAAKCNIEKTSGMSVHINVQSFFPPADSG